MRVTLLILSLWAISTSLLAQKDTTRRIVPPNYIVLKNNDTIYKPIAEINFSSTKSSLKLDDQKQYMLSDLSAYRDSNGVYKFYGRYWFRQESVGKINIYSQTFHRIRTSTYSKYAYNYVSAHDLRDYRTPGFSYDDNIFYSRKKYYIQIENETPDKYKYSSLKKVMYNDPESMLYLKKGKRIDIIRSSFFASAILLVGGGLLSVKDKPTMYGLLGGSAIAFLFSGPILKSKEAYTKAVEVYNSHYPAGVH